MMIRLSHWWTRILMLIAKRASNRFGALTGKKRANYLEHRHTRGKFGQQDLSTVERFGQQVAEEIRRGARF